MLSVMCKHFQIISIFELVVHDFPWLNLYFVLFVEEKLESDLEVRG